MGMVAAICSPLTITGTVAAGTDATAEEITELLRLGTTAVAPDANVCICRCQNRVKRLWG